MNCKEYNEKYGKRSEDFWVAIKNWLETNPERFIAFRAYIPGYTDNGYSLPCIACIGAAPGFVDEYFVSSNGTIYELEIFDEEGEENLTEWDKAYLAKWKDRDISKTELAGDSLELEAVLVDGFDPYISRWDVDGKITLKDGEIKIETTDYYCGY